MHLQWHAMLYDRIFKCLLIKSFVVIGYDPGHECRRPENETYDDPTAANETGLWDYGECSINIFSNDTGTIRNESLSCIYGHSYHRPKHLSFVSEVSRNLFVHRHTFKC